MNLTFYNISDAPEKINKTLGSGTTITGSVRGELDERSPVIEVATDVSGYNYVYIPKWRRYYFFNGCNIVRTGIYELKNCKCDVLYTFKTGILSQNVIIDKVEDNSLSQMYINDGSYVLSSKTIEEKIEFDNGFNDDTYNNVLITVGCGGS